MGHVLEHVAIELQALAGQHVTFGKTRGADRARPLPRRVRVRAADGGPRGRGTSRCACSAASCRRNSPPTWRSRSAAEPFDFAAERDGFIRFAQRRNLGPSTMSLVRAAEERGIPWIRLNDQSLIQFGHGRYQQRIQATVTSRTSHIAVELASDKEETNKILGNLGPAGAAAAAGAARGRCRVGGVAHRLPGGGEAVQRQPRARRLHQPGRRRPGRRRLPGGTADQPQRHRRDVHHRPRPPHAGGQRRARRGLQADAGSRGGRRHSTPSRSWWTR